MKELPITEAMKDATEEYYKPLLFLLLCRLPTQFLSIRQVPSLATFLSRAPDPIINEI